MSLKIIQRLLVVSALAWALVPTWGGLVYLSAWVVLIAGTWSRVRRARSVIDAQADSLKALSPDALGWVRRFALFFVWKEGAKAWSTTWRMAGLLSLLLAPWFLLRALVFAEFWELAFLPVALAMLVATGMASARLQLDEAMNDGKWPEHKKLHEEAVAHLGLKLVAGQWPPEPSPDAPPAKTS